MTSFTEVLSQIAPQQTEPLTFWPQPAPPTAHFWRAGSRAVSDGRQSDRCRVAERTQLHAYFLRAGDPTVPIDFEVDPIRDGRSFSTRRVVARQNGEAIFATSISYHRDEESVTHCFTMPGDRRRPPVGGGRFIRASAVSPQTR